MGSPDQPTHDLEAVQQSVRVWFVTHRKDALDDAARDFEMGPHDINECLLALTPNDFRKTMPAKSPIWAGCMQDVYTTVFRGCAVYLKFQLFPGQRVHVISFKRNESE